MAEIYREIHIGSIIKQLVVALDIPVQRILQFFNSDEDILEQMYHCASVKTEDLLKWSKLLEYDLFRLYSNHLILYHGISVKKENKKDSNLDKKYNFSKNLYTPEVIDYIVEMIHSNKISRSEVMSKYNIPKTTLYRWLKKHESI